MEDIQSEEISAEHVVAFVKMLALYNVIDPTAQHKYMVTPETTALIGEVAKSLILVDPNTIIKTLIFKKKECAEKITY